jgi:hypothetical protein
MAFKASSAVAASPTPDSDDDEASVDSPDPDEDKADGVIGVIISDVTAGATTSVGSY